MKNMKSKHSKELINKKIIFILIFILIVLILIAFFILSKLNDNNDTKLDNSLENTLPETQDSAPIEEQPEEHFEIVDISDIPDTYKGYKVIGKMVIEKIGVQQRILSETNDDSLKYGITKFWGPDLNEIRKCKFNRS